MVQDPYVFITFPLLDDPEHLELVAWTTTPWTLPSNLALCVNPDLEYVKARDPRTGRVYVVAECRLAELPGAVPKKKKASKKSKKGKGSAEAKGDGDGEEEEEDKGFEVIGRLKGSELVNRRFRPLFPYFSRLAATAEDPTRGAFRVLSDGYVTSDSGTGVVQQAPFFGEDDYRVCLHWNVISKDGDVVCPLDADGRFTSEVSDFEGRYIKDADRDIIRRLQAEGHLLAEGTIEHSYPFCWRSDTPLIYRAVPSWFVRVEQARDHLVAATDETRWVPTYVRDRRFRNWLQGARDWAISRSRFWGTPIPVWESEDGEERVAVGSVAELEALAGVPLDAPKEARVVDLHRHFVDKIEIPSQRGPGFPPLRRIEDVFDCWFESGSMPYASVHYPFEGPEACDRFDGTFPADFVAEGIDQTRGWFYTLVVLGVALKGRAPFKNLVCNGLVLAADGKKMSKRLKNYPDPTQVLEAYGADALRLYLIDSPVVRGETLRFREEGVRGVVRDVLLPWYNAYRFLEQNVRRWESEGAEQGGAWNPTTPGLRGEDSTNVLDRWLLAAIRRLRADVAESMEAYKLYELVPKLLRFVDRLTNVYVRLNRARLKGGESPEDAARALSALHAALLDAAALTAPVAPFFAETLWRNLRRAPGCEALPESVHWHTLPPPAPRSEADRRLDEAVARMSRAVELLRRAREKANRASKAPVKRAIVVHADPAVLEDVVDVLGPYVRAEANVRLLEASNDPLRYCTLLATPDWQALGKRLGKDVQKVAKEIKALTTDQILAFEREKTITLAGHKLGPGELVVSRAYDPDKACAALADASANGGLEAEGDGDLLVILDLSIDQQLQDDWTARELVSRLQQLRKVGGLQAADGCKVAIRADDETNQSAKNALSALLDGRVGELVRAGLGVGAVGALPAGAADLVEGAKADAAESFDLPVEGGTLRVRAAVLKADGIAGLSINDDQDDDA